MAYRQPEDFHKVIDPYYAVLDALDEAHKATGSGRPFGIHAPGAFLDHGLRGTKHSALSR